MDSITAAWTDFLRDGGGLDKSTFGRAEAASPSPGGLQRGVATVLAGKPHSTLEKRLGALRRYSKHCATLGTSAFPFAAHGLRVHAEVV